MPNIIMADQPTSGGILFSDFAQWNLDCDWNDPAVVTVNQYALYYSKSGIKNIILPNATTIGTSALSYSEVGPKLFAPQARLGSNCCYGAKNIETAIVGAIDVQGGFRRYSTMALKTLDLQMSSSTTGFGTNCFQGCSNLDTIILRGSTIQKMSQLTAFADTPMASGGTGVTIYIPKSLHDHLGDGTANDYKAATNWSTYDGYGTITWKKIEGSAYDGYYADGTSIPSA